MKRILAVDMGGTNSRFARFTADEENSLTLEQEEWFSTVDVNSFEELLTVASSKIQVEENDVLVFGVPGPVEFGHYANLVNVPWKEVDISSLRERVRQKGRKVYLINDFVSQAFGCLNEKILDAIEIKSGATDRQVGLSVVGAGTGLGHCLLVFNDNGTYTPIPSEAGQALFPFQTEAEIKYKNFLEEHLKIDFVSKDHIVSGTGLARLHHYLTGRSISPEEVAKEITPESETTIWFARFFARSCRSYALSFLPICSVLYLTGGVAINLPFLVNNDAFRDEFVQSSKRDILDRIPIKLNQNQSLGLWGNAQYGLEHL